MTTPDPSDDDVFENLELVGSRLSIAQAEIVRRLRNKLPSVIEEANRRKEAVGDKGILPVAKSDIRPAPANLISSPTNSVLVALSEQVKTLAPRTFKGEVQVVIFSYEPHAENDQMIADQYDRIQLVKGILYKFLLGCYDEKGRRCWSLLEPQMTTPLPAQVKGFGGATAYFRMVQAPGGNNWT